MNISDSALRAIARGDFGKGGGDVLATFPEPPPPKGHRRPWVVRSERELSLEERVARLEERLARLEGQE